jgi:hypothetical protein
MNHLVIRGSPDLFQWWSRILADVVRNQWELLDAQYQVGIGVLKALSGTSPVQEPELEEVKEVIMPRTSDEKADLERRALERLRQGFAPPREVYEVQNRGRLDWSSLPDWARPSDPELFEGAHEG